jgi:polysaccharide biosynthesis transport protein
MSNLGQFFLILRARWKIAVGSLLAIVLGVAGISLVLPKKYSATATVIVDFKTPDQVTGALLPMLPGYLPTQVDVIQSHRVALKVVTNLKLDQNPAIRQQFEDATKGRGSLADWMADLIARGVEVKPSKESSVLEITYSGPEPRFAATLANAFAQAYIDTNLDLRVEPARQSAGWFDERTKTLRDNLERAQAKLSEYQRSKGFTATDERLDVETARLNELSAQYSAAQGQAADALSRHRQLIEFLERGAAAESLPDVLANPLLQNLKGQLATSEARLQQLSSQLGANHPEVKRIEADIASQRQKLQDEIKLVSDGISNQARLAERRRNELRSAVAEQKTRVLQLNEGRDELTVLVREVDSAQRAYDAAMTRFTQTNLESQTTQTNVVMLSQAVEPLEPSSPKVLRNLLIATFLGTLLGVGLAFALEFYDPRVRSETELTESLALPLLGVIQSSSWAKGRRRRWPFLRTRRTVSV